MKELYHMSSVKEIRETMRRSLRLEESYRNWTDFPKYSEQAVVNDVHVVGRQAYEY